MERKAKTPASAFGPSWNEHVVIIRDGDLLQGVLDKAAFGASEFSLVHAVYEAYGPSRAGLILNALGRLFTAYIQYYSGHSCRMEDLILTPEADAKRRKLVKVNYPQIFIFTLYLHFFVYVNCLATVARMPTISALEPLRHGPNQMEENSRFRQ